MKKHPTFLPPLKASWVITVLMTNGILTRGPRGLKLNPMRIEVK